MRRDPWSFIRVPWKEKGTGIPAPRVHQKSLYPGLPKTRHWAAMRTVYVHNVARGATGRYDGVHFIWLNDDSLKKNDRGGCSITGKGGSGHLERGVPEESMKFEKGPRHLK